MDDQDFGSPGRPVSSKVLVHGDPGHCRARPPCDLPAAGVFPSKCPSIALVEMSNAPR